MVEDPITNGRLVELACISTHDLLGGLPASMTTGGAAGPASAEFRELANAGLDNANASLFRVCEQMSTRQRRLRRQHCG